MNLVGLLVELKPLVADAQASAPRILELLQRHRALAEYEVARAYAARAILPTVERQLASVDPRERRRGIEAVRLTFPRTRAAQVLRRLAKDQHHGVRERALTVAQELALDDVALPNTHITAPRYTPPWSFHGWRFGIYQPRVRKPPRFTGQLPALADAQAVAALVEHDSPEELVRFTRPGTGTGSGYVEFEVPKATGGTRRIAAPRQPLRRIQRFILHGLLDHLPAHPAAQGFVAFRSTLTNATPHCGAALVIKTDIKDFFPSLHYQRVLGLFASLGYSREVASLLAGLTTYRPVLADGTVAWPGVLPQGAPTSPSLANLACRRLDSRLTGLARRFGATYTRYADDLTFSFAEPPTINVGRFLWWVDGICQQEGFVENTAKRRVLRPGQQQRITGLVVNAVDGTTKPRVPRALRRQVRAILHNCGRDGVTSQAGDMSRDDFLAHLNGLVGYISMVQPEVGAKLEAQLLQIWSLAI